MAGAESLIVPYTGSLGQPAARPPAAGRDAGRMLIGDLLVGRFCAPATRTRLAFPLAAAMGVPLLALVFRPPLPLACLALLACGSGFAYQLGIQQAFLDSLPERRRGQGFGLNSTGTMGGQGLTPAVAGALAGGVGAAAAMAAAGAATLLAALALRGPLTGRSPGLPVKAGSVDRGQGLARCAARGCRVGVVRPRRRPARPARRGGRSGTPARHPAGCDR